MSRTRKYQPRYPVKPILDIGRIRSLSHFGYYDSVTIAKMLDLNSSTVSKWQCMKDPTITMAVADRIATTLGLHLDIIWPDPEITKMFAR